MNLAKVLPMLERPIVRAPTDYEIMVLRRAAVNGWPCSGDDHEAKMISAMYDKGWLYRQNEKMFLTALGEHLVAVYGVPS